MAGSGQPEIGGFRIERLLGTGAFATVWLGHDERLDAPVAIKVLADNWSHDLRIKERFVEEGRLLRRLDHQRVVRVHALGELPDGRPYLVMEWAQGGSLRDQLTAGLLPVDRSLAMLHDIAAGTAVLHQQDIVHRDLTPGNVLFRTRDGQPDQVVIADLGLAKALAAASGLTAQAGTPGFMAPEQNHPLATVDQRSDVYGLGCLGFALLGVPEEAGLLDGSAPLRPGVPEGVGDVLRTATQVAPADRYADAGDFAAALATAVGSTPAQPGSAPVGRTTQPRSAPVGPTGQLELPDPAGRSKRTRRWVVAAASVAVLGAVGGLVVAFAEPSKWWSAVRQTPTVSEDPAGRWVATDTNGRISVVLPAGWRAKGSGWAERPTTGGHEPALVVSPEPDRWGTEAAVAGAFLGLSKASAQVAPDAFVAGRPHGECATAATRRSWQAGVHWTVATFTGCRDGRPAIVEAAGSGPAGTGLIYVQVTPPSQDLAGNGAVDSFVDGFLAGITVRA